MDVTRDPENIMRAKQLGMTIDEFLRLNEPETKATEKAAKENKTKVVNNARKTEKNPPKQRAVQPSQGGRIKGGFGEVPI